MGPTIQADGGKVEIENEMEYDRARSEEGRCPLYIVDRWR